MKERKKERNKENKNENIDITNQAYLFIRNIQMQKAQ